MNLLVLGATGGIGMEMVRQALERGHSITALVRSVERLKPYAHRIAVLQGDLLNADELARAMNGQDAIVSGFGPRVPIAKSDHHLLRDFSLALTRAMTQTGVRRAVIVSTAFLFKDAVLPPTYVLGRMLFPGVVADATDMEDTFMRSELDWTLVRPPRLTDKPYTGRYRVREGHLPMFGFSIPRADVAECMIRIAEERTYVRAVVGVCR